MPPLGYDVQDRKLVINAEEAETVRHIFRRYLELKSVRLLKADLDAHGMNDTRLPLDWNEQRHALGFARSL